jgi:hypothetical protein
MANIKIACVLSDPERERLKSVAAALPDDWRLAVLQSATTGIVWVSAEAPGRGRAEVALPPQYAGAAADFFEALGKGTIGFKN